MFDLAELSTLRGALDIVTVQGSDVQRIAALQIKIENEMHKIQSGPPIKEEKKVSKNPNK